jgi:hypothetical protein
LGPSPLKPLPPPGARGAGKNALNLGMLAASVYAAFVFMTTASPDTAVQARARFGNLQTYKINRTFPLKS